MEEKTNEGMTEEEVVEKYKLVSERQVPNPELISELQEYGKSLSFNVGDEEVEKTITGKIETQDRVKVDFGSSINVVREGDRIFIVFGDGIKQEIDKENVDKLIKNGVTTGTYTKVEGITEVREYEKVQNKKKKAFAIAGAIALVIAIPFMAKGCSDPQKINTNETPLETNQVTMSDTYSPESDYQINVDSQEFEQVMSSVYGDVYNKIVDSLDPATVVRIAQDAYEAIDYDMEIQGSDLCKYDEIQQGVVNPGALFVQKVAAFKAKYANVKFDTASYQAMLSEAKIILSEHSSWLNMASGLVQKHAETTQDCINKGIRVEDYQEELKITNGQIGELNKRQEKTTSLNGVIQEVETIKNGIANGTVKYVINDKGDIIIMGEDITYSYASFGETKTNDVENTSNFSM